MKDLYKSFVTVDPDACLQSVKKIYPHSQIYSKYNSITDFVVIDSTGVKVVSTRTLSSSDVTDVQILLLR